MPRKPEPEIVVLRIPSRLELLGILDRVAVSICERDAQGCRDR